MLAGRSHAKLDGASEVTTPLRYSNGLTRELNGFFSFWVCGLFPTPTVGIQVWRWSNIRTYLVLLQLILPNMCYPVSVEGQDGTTSETPPSYAK
jgi:hypothetical protein